MLKKEKWESLLPEPLEDIAKRVTAYIEIQRVILFSNLHGKPMTWASTNAVVISPLRTQGCEFIQRKHYPYANMNDMDDKVVYYDAVGHKFNITIDLKQMRAKGTPSSARAILQLSHWLNSERSRPTPYDIQMECRSDNVVPRLDVWDVGDIMMRQDPGAFLHPARHTRPVKKSNPEESEK